MIVDRESTLTYAAATWESLQFFGISKNVEIESGGELNHKAFEESFISYFANDIRNNYKILCVNKFDS